MFQKGLALKQKKIQSKIIDFLSFHKSSLILSGTTTSHTESTIQTTTDSNTKKSRSVTLSSVLLAKRFSSTLLAPINRNNITVTNLNSTNETTITTKKQHNPRRHVFATAGANENQNPVQSTTSSGEKVKIFK
jgi:ABC-type metal ion transport system substrate-binding protein